MSEIAEGAMTIQELVTKLGFDVDESKLKGFEKGLHTAEIAAEALTIAWHGLVLGLFELTRETAEYGEEVEINSQLLGISTDKFQKLRFAAQSFGIENENIITALRFFNKTLGEMAQGTGRGGVAISALHLNMQQIKNQSVDKTLAQVADGMHKIDSATTRAAISAELFGRSGAHFGQFISQGSKAVEQIGEQIDGLLMTPEQVEMSQKTRAALIQLQAIIVLVRNEIGVRLFPVVQKITNQISDWVKNNKALLETRIDRFVNIVTAAVQMGWEAIKKIVAITRFWIQVFGGLENTLKIIGLALASIFSVRIISGIAAAAAELRELGLAALLAEGEILLIPAAILGVLLALDDLRAYLSGEDSVIGTVFGPFSEIKKQFTQFTLPFDHIIKEFSQLKTGLKNVWRDLFKKNGSLHELLTDAVPKLFHDSEGVFINVGEIIGNAMLIGIRVALFKPIQEILKTLPTVGSAVSGGPVGMLMQLLGKQGAASLWDDGLTPFIKRGAALPGMGQFYDLNKVPYSSPNAAAAGGMGNYFNITVPMPAGTPQAHIDYFRASAEKIANEVLGKHIVHTMQNAASKE